MLSLRMAGVILVVALYFMYVLNLWLPAVLFYTIGALWSAYALMQIADEEEK